MDQVTSFDLSVPDRPTIVKAPGSDLDYTFDWAKWLDAIGDQIASFTLETGGGVSVVTAVSTAKTVTVWVSTPPTMREIGRVTCSIVTSSNPPRDDTRSMYFDVRVR